MTAFSADPIERMIQAGLDRMLRDAREKFHRFGPAVVREADGRAVEFDPLQLAWVAHLDYCWARGLHAGIFTPRPTAGFTALLATWLVGRDPQERVKVVCGSESQATLRMRTMRGVVRSQQFAKVFPGAISGERWTDHTMYVERPGHPIEPMLEAAGVGVKPAGAGITKLLFDSVVDPESSSTFERRQAQKAKVDNLWMSRLEPGARVLWIAAPVNADDPSYAMRAREDFVWLEQRVSADGQAWEQEAYAAPEDYLEATRAAVLGML